MGVWYPIGIFLGLGIAAGVLLAGPLAAMRYGALGAGALAAAVVATVAALVVGVPEAVAGGVGGFVGALGVAPLVRSARARGATLGGTTILIAGAAVVLAGFAFVPLLGYVYAVAVPVLAARLRRSASRTHEGLRILARD